MLLLLLCCSYIVYMKNQFQNPCKLHKSDLLVKEELPTSYRVNLEEINHTIIWFPPYITKLSKKLSLFSQTTMVDNPSKRI